MEANNVKSESQESDTASKTIISVFEGEVLTGAARVVRLYEKETGSLEIALTTKRQKNAVYFLLSKENIDKVIAEYKTLLPENFQNLTQSEFDKMPSLLKEDMQNKLLASMGFALKTKKAVIGKRAIDRQISLFPDLISDIFIADDASEEISRKFQERAANVRFTSGFPASWIQKISAREKASYFLLKKNYTNHHIYDDYKHYQMLSHYG